MGYAPFAERICRVILKLTPVNGYVIGLHGKWGSGKSTALNFILEYLEKHNIENKGKEITHIDFRPWIVSGHQDLIVAFFKILSENLGPREGFLKRHFRPIAKFINGTTDNLVDAAATVAITVDPSGGIASGFAGNLAKKSFNSMLSSFLEDPSLQTAYESLKTQLAASGRRFLVTVDDIDRLGELEVRTIMQLVKSIGQLPNVTYLLAYDRVVVWRALDQAPYQDVPHFAEKIVQQEIELPTPNRGALLAILNTELSFLLNLVPESARWIELVQQGIDRWIRSPRDIVRLSNAVKFSWSALQYEIDPQDLLAMEGLRLFDSDAFNWVRDNRDFLFSQGRYILAQNDLKLLTIESLRARIQKESQPQLMRVISVLFPQESELLENRKSYGGESYIEVQRRRGIGSEAGYDAYFGMHPSADTIPNAVINDLISKLNNAKEIENIIRSYFDRKNSRGELMLGKLLDELLVRFRSRDPVPPTKELLVALFQVGGNLLNIEDYGNAFTLSPRAQVSLLVRTMLQAWGTHAAGKSLVAAFKSGGSVAFLAEIYVDRGRELGIFKSDTSVSPLIDQIAYIQIGKILFGRIKAAAKNGTLEESPFFFNIERSWGHLDSPLSVKRWLSSGMKKSGKFLATAGKGLVSYSIGSVSRSYTMSGLPDESFYDLQVISDSAAKHAKDSELSQDELNLIAELARGAKAILGERSTQSSSSSQQLKP